MKTIRMPAFFIIAVLLVNFPVMAQENNKDTTAASTTADAAFQKESADKVAVADDKNASSRKKDEKKYDIKLSGTLYSEWFYEVTNANSAGATKANQFRITRAYITLDKQFNDIFSAKIQSDFLEGYNDLKLKNSTPAAQTKADEVDKTTTKYSYNGILKNAYVQAKYGIDPVDMTLQVGLIGTPILSMIDKQSGYRWIVSNYIDGAKNILGNKTWGAKNDVSLNDNSADLGASLSIQVMKMITMTYAVTNGEGYKSVIEQVSNNNSNYRGKAQYGVITLSPVKFVYLNGFVRHEYEEKASTADKTIDKQCLYGGGGAGVDMMGVKLGGYYAYGFHEYYANGNSGVKDSRARVLDTYLNTDLKELAGFPILVYGRFAWGKDNAGDKSTKRKDTYLWAAGLGYEFNHYIKAGVYYEDYNIDYAWNNHSRTFYVKTEVKI